MSIMGLALLLNGVGLVVAAITARAAWRGVQEANGSGVWRCVRSWSLRWPRAPSAAVLPIGWRCRVRNLGPGPALVGDRPFSALSLGRRVFEAGAPPSQFPNVIPSGGAIECTVLLENPSDIPLLSDWPWPFTITYADMFGVEHATRIEIHPELEVVLTRAQVDDTEPALRSLQRWWASI